MKKNPIKHDKFVEYLITYKKTSISLYLNKSKVADKHNQLQASNENLWPIYVYMFVNFT